MDFNHQQDDTGKIARAFAWAGSGFVLLLVWAAVIIFCFKSCSTI